MQPKPWKVRFSDLWHSLDVPKHRGKDHPGFSDAEYRERRAVSGEGWEGLGGIIGVCMRKSLQGF